MKVTKPKCKTKILLFFNCTKRKKKHLSKIFFTFSLILKVDLNQTEETFRDFVLYLHLLKTCGNDTFNCDVMVDPRVISYERYYFFFDPLLVIRQIFVFLTPWSKLPIAYTFNDLKSIMIDNEDKYVLTFDYLKYHGQIFEGIKSVYNPLSLKVNKRNFDEYFLCAGLFSIFVFNLFFFNNLTYYGE